MLEEAFLKNIERKSIADFALSHNKNKYRNQTINKSGPWNVKDDWYSKNLVKI